MCIPNPLKKIDPNKNTALFLSVSSYILIFLNEKKIKIESVWRWTIQRSLLHEKIICCANYIIDFSYHCHDLVNIQLKSFLNYEFSFHIKAISTLSFIWLNIYCVFKKRFMQINASFKNEIIYLFDFKYDYISHLENGFINF